MSIIVPYDQLRPETLEAVIEEFVTRSGAVHGHTDTPLDAQMQSIRDQLKSGKVVIVFDNKTGSCTMCLTDELRKARRSEGDTDAVGELIEPMGDGE